MTNILSEVISIYHCKKDHYSFIKPYQYIFNCYFRSWQFVLGLSECPGILLLSGWQENITFGWYSVYPTNPIHIHLNCSVQYGIKCYFRFHNIHNWKSFLIYCYFVLIFYLHIVLTLSEVQINHSVPFYEL